MNHALLLTYAPRAIQPAGDPSTEGASSIGTFVALVAGVAVGGAAGYWIGNSPDERIQNAYRAGYNDRHENVYRTPGYHYSASDR